MNIKTLSDSELESALKKKVSCERQITVEIISLLEEVNSRRLYLQRGFGSLIEYCIKELNYSESSAYRRISAMRVAQEVPTVKVALADGSLNLVSVSRAQTIFQKEAKNKKALSCVEKFEVLTSLENRSSREAEKILLKISPQTLPQEKVREVSESHTEVSLVLSEDLMKKLKELKGLFSHKIANPSYAELIDLLADLALKKYQVKPQSNTSAGVASKWGAPSEKEVGESASAGTRTRTRTSGRMSFKREYIPKSLRQSVWLRAESKCQFRDSKSQRQCDSKFQLQVEHKVPVAKGGSNAPENLELLCAAHNRQRAIEQFGVKHMHRYF